MRSMPRSELSQLVREAWHATERQPASPTHPTWSDAGDDAELGGRIVRLARLAAALHLGRAVPLAALDAADAAVTRRGEVLR